MKQLLESKNSNNDQKTWNMFDVPFYGGSKAELLDLLANDLDNKIRGKIIATVNPEFIMEAQKDRQFLKLLQSTFNVVDGNGLAWAARIKCGRVVEVMPGCELIDDFCKLAEIDGYGVYFLGGWKDRAKETSRYFVNKYPKLKVVGYFEGEPDKKPQEILEKLKNKKIDILFVAFGMKKQEQWIVNNKEKLDFGVAMGVGRSFDYYSGNLKRAPKIWRKLHLEWLFSLLIEPKRIKRQLVLPKFVLKVLFPALK